MRSTPLVLSRWLAGAQFGLGHDPSSPSTLLQNHGASDAYLEESGVAHVIVRPNRFLQHVTQNVFPSIDPDGNFYSDEGCAAEHGRARDGDTPVGAAGRGGSSPRPYDGDGWLVGELSDPMPVNVDPGGRLSVRVAHVA